MAIRSFVIFLLVVMSISASVMGTSGVNGRVKAQKSNEKEALAPQSITKLAEPGINRKQGKPIQDFLELMLKQNQESCYYCGSPCSN